MNIIRFLSSKKGGFLVVLLLAAAIPLTVMVSQKQTQIQQNAWSWGIQLDSNSAANARSIMLTTSAYWQHTVGSNQNRILLVSFSIKGNPGYDNLPPLVKDTSYGGISLTRYASVVNTQTHNIATEVWYLVNPPPGTNTIKVNFTKPAVFVAGSTSWSNVNQTNPLSSFNTSQTLNINNISVNLGEIVFDSTTLTFSEKNNCGLIVGTGQIISRIDRIDYTLAGGGSYKTQAEGGGTYPYSTSMSWSPTCSLSSDYSSNYWVHVAGKLQPASSASLTPIPVPSSAPPCFMPVNIYLSIVPPSKVDEFSKHFTGKYTGWGYGDVDLDGSVTAKDALLILKFVADPKNNFLPPIAAELADVDGTPNVLSSKSDVSSADALQILRYVARLPLPDGRISFSVCPRPIPTPTRTPVLISPWSATPKPTNYYPTPTPVKYYPTPTKYPYPTSTPAPRY